MKRSKTKLATKRTALTAQDRKLADALFAHGPSAFVDAGLTLDQCGDFLKREDVKAYIGTLLSEMRGQEEQDARRRFILKRDMARMAMDAVGVVRDSLRGPEYAKLPNGAIMADGFGNPIITGPEPTNNQAKTARYVLETLGLSPDRVEGAATSDLASLVAASLPPPAPPPLRYEDDETTAQQQALARERRRAVIEAFVRHLPKLRDAADKALARAVAKRRVTAKVVDDAA